MAVLYVCGIHCTPPAFYGISHLAIHLLNRTDQRGNARSGHSQGLLRPLWIFNQEWLLSEKSNYLHMSLLRKTLSVGTAGVSTHNLLHGRLALLQQSQLVGPVYMHEGFAIYTIPCWITRPYEKG